MPQLALEFSGFDVVLKNLNLADKKIGGALRRGLIQAGKYLLKASRDIVPVQTGNLKRSGFVRNIGGPGIDAVVVVGYQANYGIYVHENMNNVHGWAFNIKYSREIMSRSHVIKSGKNAGKIVYATVKSGWAPRGENQQANPYENGT
jgi:hypothetical protein